MKGYEYWITGLEEGITDRFGLGYNATLWSECRHYTVEFLLEIEDIFSKDHKLIHNECLGKYRMVAESLGNIAREFPWIPKAECKLVEKNEKSEYIVELLKTARDSEAEGLKLLEDMKNAI